MQRRDFLHHCSAAAMAAALAGCGSNSSFNPGYTSTGAGGSTNNPPAGGTMVSGRVDTTQIGGQGLQGFSIFEEPGLLAADGTVLVGVPADMSQILLLLDSADAPRALTIYVPGLDLAYDARSTATALIFLSPGIGTADPELSKLVIKAIQAAPSFAALEAAIKLLLPTQTVAQVVANPGVQALLVAVAGEFTVTQILPRSEAEQAEIDRNGGVHVLPNPDTPADAFEMTIYNEGWRFVAVVREDFDLAGNSVRVVVPDLRRSPFGQSHNGMSGINGFGFGNFVTGQENTPSDTSDIFDTTSPELSKSIYWVQGVGSLTHPNNSPSSALTFSQDKFGLAPDIMTLLFYIVLPVLEIITASGSIGKTQLHAAIEEMEPQVNAIAASSAWESVVLANNTGNEGNKCSAYLDLSFTFLQLGLSQVVGRLKERSLDKLAPSLAQKIGARVVFVCGLFGGFCSASNFVRAAHYVATVVPQLVDVEVRNPNAKFLELLGGSSVIEVLAVNAGGSMVYNVPGSGMFYKRFGAAPLHLTPGDGDALLTDTEFVFYQARDGHITDAVLRGPDLVETLVKPPAGTSPFNQGLAGLTPDGKAVGRFRRLDGVADFFYFAKLPGALPGFLPGRFSESTGLDADNFIAVGASENFACFWGPSAVDGGVSRTICYLNMKTGVWTKRVTAVARLGGSQSIDIVDYNNLDELLIHTYQDRQPVPSNDYQSTNNVFLENVAGTRATVKTVEDTMSGDRTENLIVRRASATALNDAGDVAGNYFEVPRGQPSVTHGVIWSRTGTQRDIATILPAGAPAGVYLPKRMRGKFMILERNAPDGSQSIYLFGRGGQ